MNAKQRHSVTFPLLALLFCGAIAAQPAIDPAYEIRFGDNAGPDEAWLAANPRQGFDATFAGDRLSIEPASDDAGWSFEMALLRYGRDGFMVPARLLREPATRSDRIELERDNLTEWYLNSPAGLEQGFDIVERPDGPAGSGLVLELGMKTDLHPVFSTDGQAVELFEERQLALRYSKLVVTDKNGRRLPSRMEGFAAVGERGIRLVIDDREAVYPIVVDPIVTTMSWNAFGPNASSAFGQSVAPAGDVNGDGYGDVIVGAPNGENGESNEGMAFVYLGSPSGLAATPVWSVESNDANGLFGYSVSTAGDINADGFADVIVGCIYCDGGGSFRGQALVYFGSATGPSMMPDHTFSGSSDWELLGASVSSAGDFNDDGYSDVIIGQPGWNSSQGRASLYFGSAGGLTPGPVLEASPSTLSFGIAVAGGGDIDGDGYSDVAIGAPNGTTTHDGKVHVYFGAPSGYGGKISAPHPTGALDGHFGAALAFVGDTTGDGTSDLAVTAYNEVEVDPPLAKTGKLYVFTNMLSTYWTAIASTSQSVSYGNSVAAAGDIDDDGLADLFVADQNFDDIANQYGRVEVVQNLAGSQTSNLLWNSQSALSPAIDDLVGTSVAVSDVNGDGRPDLIIGGIGRADAPADDKGEVMVFHSGPASGQLSPPRTTSTAVVSGPPRPVGDVNGDGFVDIAVGHGGLARVEVFHGSANGLLQSPPDAVLNGFPSFGESIAGAGDVDGDGYEDVLVGTPEFFDTANQEGRVSLFLGSPTGLSTSAAWTFESGQELARLGSGLSSLAGLGDINGDGYADFGAGAPFWTGGQTDEGAVFVFHGSPTGPGATFDRRLEVDRASLSFGERLDAAGDVNGDGYSDLIVGAPDYTDPETNEGAAFLYLGGPTGLAPLPDWQAESDLPNAYYGAYVAGAGDLDGDGFGDIAVGATGYSNPETNEGSVWVYYGGPFGPPATPDLLLESDMPSAGMGYIRGSGDFNADGFSDLLLTATPTLMAPYFGSAAGLATTPGPLAPNVSWPELGDVNGDGYTDMIGWPVSAQAIKISYANSSNAADRGNTMRVRRVDDSAPVAPLGTSDSDTAFRVHEDHPTWIGRADVRVEVEVKPYGVPFDGLGTVVLGPRDSSTSVSYAVDSLMPGTMYHWRSRHWFDPIRLPGFLHGPWLAAPNNAWSEPDFRTSGNATASAVPDGDNISGTPLTIGLDSSGPELQIVLEWGEACGEEATDYAIYIGDIGDFTSHVPCTCSTGGLTNHAYPPDRFKDQYYLVVPVNTAGQREGSYGVDGNGLARPASVVACHPTGEPVSCGP